jgi:hypothetical protein
MPSYKKTLKLIRKWLRLRRIEEENLAGHNRSRTWDEKKTKQAERRKNKQELKKAAKDIEHESNS